MRYVAKQSKGGCYRQRADEGRQDECDSDVAAHAERSIAASARGRPGGRRSELELEDGHVGVDGGRLQ